MFIDDSYGDGRAGIMEPLMTAAQTAKALCVSPRTVWTLTQEGALACIRIGRRVLYAPADIRAFIARCRAGDGQLISAFLGGAN